MFHVADQVALAAAGTGRVSISLVALIMIGALIAIISLMWAKRLWMFELIACAIFFGLLGGTPFGRAIYDWLAHTTVGG